MAVPHDRKVRHLPLKKGITARMVGVNQEVLLTDKSLTLEGSPGDYLSLFSLTPSVEGLITTGLKYPLHGESLNFASTRGLSNEFSAHKASVRFSSGLLLIVKSNFAS